MVNYSQLTGEALVVMERPFMVDSPSGGAPAKAPRWDLTATEGYGGGNCFSLVPWMFSGYVGIYRRKNYVGGRPRGPRDRGGRLEHFLACTPSPLDHVLSKNHTPEGFIPFGLRLIFLFFKILKYEKKQQYGLGLRLVG